MKLAIVGSPRSAREWKFGDPLEPYKRFAEAFGV